jgi:hypothetical protein
MRMTNGMTVWLKAHWFFGMAAVIIAVNVLAMPGIRADLPYVAEPAALFDLAVLLPALFWLAYRRRHRDAVLRALALACLGIWVVSWLIPESEQRLLPYLTPLRYAGLAVLLAIEFRIVLALYRAVFSGASRGQAAEQIRLQADLPLWLSRLLAAEAVFWKRVHDRVMRLFRR